MTTKNINNLSSIELENVGAELSDDELASVKGGVFSIFNGVTSYLNSAW